MKTIGLLGGMSWESSLHYYRLVNQAVKTRLGGLHSARCILYSVDFAPIEALMAADRWPEVGEVLANAAASLEAAGAGFVVLCTNSLHAVADTIQARVAIPLLHIADATGAQVRAKGVRRVGLLGTRFTMEQDFYRGRLAERYGLEVLVPEFDDRIDLHRVIFEELCVGRVEPASEDALRRMAESLVARGAEGVILGCTELMMLMRPGDVEVPLFDTTSIHAEAAVAAALEEPVRT